MCVCCLVCVVQLSLQEMAFAWNVCHIHWCSYLDVYMTRYYQCFSRLTQRILFPSENGVCVCVCVCVSARCDYKAGNLFLGSGSYTTGWSVQSGL